VRPVGMRRPRRRSLASAWWRACSVSSLRPAARACVILPAATLYQPIWDYDAKTLANDLSAHLVYGLATAAALRVFKAPHE